MTGQDVSQPDDKCADGRESKRTEGSSKHRRKELYMETIRHIVVLRKFTCAKTGVHASSTYHNRARTIGETLSSLTLSQSLRLKSLQSLVFIHQAALQSFELRRRCSPRSQDRHTAGELPRVTAAYNMMRVYARQILRQLANVGGDNNVQQRRSVSQDSDRSNSRFVICKRVDASTLCPELSINSPSLIYG